LLEKELGTDALVIYAAPVFHKQQDLYNHTSGQTIVANSTFQKVSLLRGHKKWYFDRGGIKGVANLSMKALIRRIFYHKLKI
jgi:hypothetical protein